MPSRTAIRRALALFLLAGGAAACSHPPPPEAPSTPQDVYGSVALLRIPACDAYVYALEEECFGQPGHAFPAGVAGLLSDRVGVWRHDVDEPGGRNRVAGECASALDATRTFHCEVR
jgi:hypothetical protein